MKSKKNRGLKRDNRLQPRNEPCRNVKNMSSEKWAKGEGRIRSKKKHLQVPSFGKERGCSGVNAHEVFPQPGCDKKRKSISGGEERCHQGLKKGKENCTFGRRNSQVSSGNQRNGDPLLEKIQGLGSQGSKGGKKDSKEG